jgi:hypothetical protein
VHPGVPGGDRDVAYLGDQNDLQVLGVLFEKRVGDVQAGEGATENDDGCGHVCGYGEV